MNLLNTLKTNWRDLLVGIAITLLAALFADIITGVAAQQNGMVWLATVAEVLKGSARFFAANMIGFLGLAVAWPTINKFSNESFGAGWNQFSTRDKLVTLIAVSCVYVLAAALCVS